MNIEKQIESLIDEISGLKKENTSLKEQLAAKNKEWISVEDRLPDDREVVIIFWNYENKKRVTSGSYNSSNNYWQHGNATQLNVTHWMPLPNTPK